MRIEPGLFLGEVESEENMGSRISPCPSFDTAHRLAKCSIEIYIVNFSVVVVVVSASISFVIEEQICGQALRGYISLLKLVFCRF